MSNPPRSRHRRLGAITGLVASWLAGAVGAMAQAPCSLANPVNWCVHQDSTNVSGGAEEDDRFGSALAFGDFNGDGFDDLAVGVAGENNGAGFVYLFYSNGQVPSVPGHQAFSQDQLNGTGAENGDELGAALAAGDFDDDGFDDLAIGSPGEDLSEPDPDDCTLGECEDAGGFHVVYGGAGGLQLASSAFFTNGSLSGNPPNEGARLGATLAVGDFDGDGVDDLAVGMPLFESTIGLNPPPEEGLAFVAFGAPGGLGSGAEAVVIGALGTNGFCAEDSPRRFGAALAPMRQATIARAFLAAGSSHCEAGGVNGTGGIFIYEEAVENVAAEYFLLQSDYGTAGNGPDDHFAIALAVGDFDNADGDDLAAGAPNKNHGAGNPSDSGRVYVAYNGGGGVDNDSDFDIIGEDEWAGDTPGAGEQFGSALAAGDVDGDGFDDLLAGAPGEGSADVGRVYLKRGSVLGLTTLGNQLFTQTLLGGSNGTDDHLGNVIALGDVDGDGELEIALGVPDKDVGTADDAGMVYVTRAFGSQLFSDGFESGTKGAWSASTP